MAQVGDTGRQADNAVMTRSRIDSDKPKKSSGRSQRLAMELRENLRRRKAQERGRATPPGSGEPRKPGVASRDDRVS
jgi:hypothetical protein